MKLPIPEIDFDAIGGRAFVLAVGCGAVNSVMKWFEHLDNGSYTAIILGTIGCFIAANAIEKHGKIKAETAIATAEIAATGSTTTVPGALGAK